MTETATTPTTDADQPDEAAETPPETPQEAAEGPERPERGPEDPPEPQQPADAVDDVPVALVVDSPAGSLTLRPNQKALDPEQHAALLAIGVDIANDPGVVPHLRAFVHMCQIRGLDMWAREAYLIGRGKGENRKWTMQTGIDGYRKLAKVTGRFIRVKSTYWTGTDADDRSYKMVEVDGDFVMKRVWYDQWPASWGHPGAAKVVIEHYDDFGNVTTTSAVADWGMYAPYNDVWEGTRGNRQKKIGPDGKPVQELSAMWERGGPHMLAKCAEALAHRRAFPAAMSGMYIAEEMHRLDATERERLAEEKARTRREAFEAAQREQRTATPVVDAEPVEDGQVGPDVQQAVDNATANGEQAADWLRAEFEWQAEVLGQKPSVLARRVVQAKKRNYEDLTADDMLPLVVGLRSMVVNAIRDVIPTDAVAARYASIAAEVEGVIDWDALIAGQSPEEADAAAAAEHADEVDPDQPHEYRNDPETGTCADCGDLDGRGVHA